MILISNCHKNIKRFFFTIIIIFLFLGNFSSISYANTFENCRIEASHRIVSLGFPIRSERLANLSTANVLVLPYQLKGEQKFSISDTDKAVFERAANNVSLLSYGKLQLNFIYNPTIELATSAADLDTIKENQQKTYTNDFTKSTWGFVSRTIKENDKVINYTGIDSVVLVGKSSEVKQEIAEAFMFTNDKHQLTSVLNDIGGNWFDPIKTDEGNISNAVLLYNRLFNSIGDYTLTHELMHNVGLVDLYGYNFSPSFSLMYSAGTLSLLPYEQFVLGWLPKNNLICINKDIGIDQNLTKNRFIINYFDGNHSLIIPTGASTALVIDVANNNSDVVLIYYSVDTTRRPPIEIFNTKILLDKKGYISNYDAISAQLVSPEYTVLISDNDGFKVAIDIIPSKQINTQEAINMIKAAELKKIDLKSIAAKTKADDDAKEKTVAIQKSTIICIKGKLTKKIIAINPKCPAGYKKK